MKYCIPTIVWLLHRSLHYLCFTVIDERKGVTKNNMLEGNFSLGPATETDSNIAHLPYNILLFHCIFIVLYCIT